MASAPRVDQRPDEVVPNPDPSALTTAHIEKEVGNLELRLMARIDGIQKAIDVFNSDLTRVPTLLDRSILGLRELIETRIICMENDIKGVHDFLDTRAADINERISHLRELVKSNIENVNGNIEKLELVSIERFTRIDTQFIERDKRTDQISLADKTAVAAALQAAKEAVGAQNTSNSIAIAKSESSTVESIKQLQALFNTAIDAMTERINDVKSRLDKGEGKTSVSDPAVSNGIHTLGAQIASLGTSRDMTAGKSQGGDQMWGMMLGAAGVLMSFVTLAVLLFKG